MYNITLSNLIRDDLLNYELINCELILLTTTIILPFTKKFIDNYIYNDKIKDFSTIILNQYTNWNLFLIMLNILYSNDYLEYFITINSSSIFIIYHIIYYNNILNLFKIFIIYDSYYEVIIINIGNFFMHILPVIYYINKYIDKKIIIDINMGYQVCLFNMLWSLQVVGNFDPSVIYVEMNTKHLYIMWYFVCILNISIGFGLNYYLLL
jgi:hypothetical protein